MTSYQRMNAIESFVSWIEILGFSLDHQTVFVDTWKRMAKIPSYQHKGRFYILAFITLAATLSFLYKEKNRSENMKDNEGGITRIIKDKRIQLVQNGCRKILSENRLRTSYIEPENFVTIKRWLLDLNEKYHEGCIPGTT